jgi:hypothetical protein
MKQVINILLVASIWLSASNCQERPSGYFRNMPSRFIVDSLQTEKELFQELVIHHDATDIIALDAGSHCNIIPFCGFLKANGDTLFYKRRLEDKFRPFLNLNAPKFDTITFKYFDSRIDDVVSMGKMYDSIFKDSINYFQLIPRDGRSIHHERYIRYVAIKAGGIRYLTFRTQLKDYSIWLKEHPILVWSSQ